MAPDPEGGGVPDEDPLDAGPADEAPPAPFCESPDCGSGVMTMSSASDWTTFTAPQSLLLPAGSKRQP